MIIDPAGVLQPLSCGVSHINCKVVAVLVRTVHATAVQQFPVELGHPIVTGDMLRLDSNGIEAPRIEVHLHFGKTKRQWM